MKKVTLTTDGGCHPNPGRGGWACILRYGSSSREISGHEENVTNNLMELRAIVEGLEALKEPCELEIRTDSRTAIAWCRPGAFKTEERRAKYARAYALSLRAIKLMVLGQHKVTFTWVKGHHVDPDNIRCDYLAALELRRLPWHTEAFAQHDAIGQQLRCQMEFATTRPKGLRPA